MLDHLVLFFVSLISNIFSAFSGGGAGVIQLPAILLLYDIAFINALATHKIATVALGVGATSKFKTVIAFVDGKIEHSAEGVVKGLIVEKHRGVDGFGYDPIFQPESRNLTYAEMDADEKNRISHRFKALDKIKEFLIPYFSRKGGNIDLK